MYLYFFFPGLAAASFIINVAPVFTKKKLQPHSMDILHNVTDIPWPQDDPDIPGLV